MLSVSPELVSEYKGLVVETYQSAVLDSGRCLITGSSVLPLLGFPRRPGDLDVVLSPSYFDELVRQGQTGGIQIAEVKAALGYRALISLGTPDSGRLSLDMCTYSHPGKNFRFEYFRRAALTIPCGTVALQVIPPAAIAIGKNTSERDSDRADAAMLYSYLDQLKNGESINH
jgi:hypothetical protein